MIHILAYLCLIILSTCAQSQKNPKDYDITNNGNYLIARCGKDVPGGKAEHLISLLREIGRDIPVIVTEAKNGTASAYGFESLFTSNDAMPAVTTVFSLLSDSESVSVRGQDTQIRFVCVEPDDPGTASIYAYAMSVQGMGVAWSRFGTADIYLFPSFFARLSRNPTPYQCPVFRPTRLGVWPVENGHEILGTSQYAVLFHELVDKYLHLDGIGSHVEKYNLFECIRMSAQDQLLNAENYAMFASGRVHV